MKLLIITQTVDTQDPILGFFHRWLEVFSARLDNVEVITLHEGIHHLPGNVHIHSLGKENGASRLKYMWRFFRYSIGARRDYDAVLVHMNPEYVLLGGWLWRLMGKRIGLWYTHKSVTWRLRIAEKFAHVIFTASKESFRLSSAKIIVTGHGIDTGFFQPVSVRHTSAELRMVSVSRIAAVKNLDIILRAAAIVGRSRPVELIFAGAPITERDRHYQEQLKHLAKELGVKQSVRWLGPISHEATRALYQSADVFVNCSSTGSIDKAVLEAMACETPVVTSNEAFKSFIPAEFYTRNTPEALAQAIQSLQQYPAKELRNWVVQGHNLERTIDQIVRQLQ